MEIKHWTILLIMGLVAMVPSSRAQDHICTKMGFRQYSEEDVEGNSKPMTMTRIEEFCCADYYRNEEGLCKPVCEQNCPNGDCVEPGKCNCHEGYVLDETTKICQPVCSKNCEFGKCIKPETCDCFKGYKHGNDSYICEPDCVQKCPAFSLCVQPDQCDCVEGYRYNANVTSTLLCEPFCKSGCSNGTCIAPDRCDCNIGFSMNSTTLNCEENICPFSCPLNAHCTGNAGGCACNPGYMKSLFNRGPTIQCKERLVHTLELLSIFLFCILMLAIIIMCIVKMMVREKSYEPHKTEEKYNNNMKHTAM